MELLIITLSAVNIVLAFVLVITTIRLKARAKDRTSEELSSNNDFRREVSEYLEKAMNQSLETTRSLYKSQEESSKAIASSLSSLQQKLSDSLMDLTLSQKREMEAFSEKTEAKIEKIREENDKSRAEQKEEVSRLLKDTKEELGKIREDNDKKLDQMRLTVDEKLQKTLDVRLSENFKIVSNNLDQLRVALSEINKLSRDVSDLNKIFSNVKSRGVWGEVQIEAILSDILTPDQYEKNFHPRLKSQEVVEFAVRLPGRGEGEVFIPIDSKFPKEDYERYVDAISNHNEEGAELALKALRSRVRKEAQDISEKYINPPRTTDFAILFVPTESLYAELLRQPGYVEEIQNHYKVIISGPTTFSALLISLSMGFRTLQIEKKTKEVKDLFAKIKDQIEKFSLELMQSQNAIGTAGRKIEAVIKRSNMIKNSLSKIELPDERESIDIPLVPHFDEDSE